MSISPDSQKLVSGSEDKTLKLWHLDGQEIATFKGHSDSIIAVSFSPDGKKIVSGSWDKTIKIWNLDPQEIASFKKYEYEEIVKSFSFSPDGQMIASRSDDDKRKIWSLDGKKIEKLPDDKNFMRVRCRYGNNIYIECLKINNQDERRLKLIGHNNTVTSLSISSDLETIVFW